MNGLVPSYRQCWVLEGDVEQSYALVTQRLSRSARTLSFGAKHIPFKQAKNYLGQEYDYLIIDTQDGLPVDAFAALLGTLRGGGLLLLLVEDFSAWPDQLDAARESLASYPGTAKQVGQHFMQRLCRHFDQADCVQRFSQDEFALQPLPLFPQKPTFSLTLEQQQVIDAVKRVALGHAKRPLVLTADRGRGKSTALGEALAQLLDEHPRKKIIVLAPNRAAVETLFARLSQSQQDNIQFSLPQDYLRDRPTGDLLVVDEAAAIPLPVLNNLLQSHNRLVFSSTVHGYEGSGRGFALRFARLLDQQMPQWKPLSIQQPVRWAESDALEKLTNDVFLLNAELPDEPQPDNPYTLRWISQDELAANENLLRQLFALLVTAHYQTRPSDLRQLLDSPDLCIQIALKQNIIVGALLAVQEGGLEADLAQAICAGERRPRGHMLLQSLACHAGWCTAPTFKLLRVMRIAVHPACRRLGIGSAMLQAAKTFAQEQQVDLLGTAFGLDADLLNFWRKAGYQTARIGHKPDPASGARSVQMLLGLNSSGDSFCQTASQRFQQQLPWRLGKQFNDLDAASVAWLMLGRDCGDLPLSEIDNAELHAYAQGQRPLDEVWPALWRWYCRVMSEGRQSALTADQQTLLLAYILQHKSALEIQQMLSIKGRGSFEKTLCETVKSVLTAT